MLPIEMVAIIPATINGFLVFIFLLLAIVGFPKSDCYECPNIRMEGDNSSSLKNKGNGTVNSVGVWLKKETSPRHFWQGLVELLDISWLPKDLERLMEYLLLRHFRDVRDDPYQEQHLQQQ